MSLIREQAAFISEGSTDTALDDMAEISARSAQQQRAFKQHSGLMRKSRQHHDE